MRVDDVIALLANIAERPADVSFGAYLDYIEQTIGMVREVIAAKRGDFKPDIPLSEIETKLIEKAKKLYQLYFHKKLTLAPEHEYVVVFRAFTRQPLFPWSSEISEDKRQRLRRLVQKAGQIICAGWRLWNKCVLVDFDVLQGGEPVAGVLRDFIIKLTRQLGLPIKLTWHGGVHVYIPLTTKAVFEQGGVLFKNRARPVMLEGNGVKIRVEFLIDAVTHHPLTSWLWLELDESDIPKGVTIARCAIPVNHPAENWFVFGRSISYSISDASKMLADLIEQTARELGLRIVGEVPTIQQADESILKKAVSDTALPPFREAVQVSTGVGGGTHAFQRVDLRKVADTYLFDKSVDYDTFMTVIVPKLADYGLLPNCVDYMIYRGEDLDPDVIKHYVFIVAWYLLQQMKCWWLNREVAQKLCPHVAQLHGLRPRLYYYYYYAWSLVYDPVHEDYRFVRPNSIPQLAEAWHELATSNLCKSCRFRTICRGGVKDKTVSTRLTDVVNMIAYEIFFEHHDLAIYLDPDVEKWILRPSPFTPRFLRKVTNPEFRAKDKKASGEE